MRRGGPPSPNKFHSGFARGAPHDPALSHRVATVKGQAQILGKFNRVYDLYAGARVGDIANHAVSITDDVPRMILAPLENTGAR